MVRRYSSGPLPANVNANSTLVWDSENRLIEAQVNGGGTVNFIYDSQSRRISETVGTTTKVTVYDGWNPIAEYTGSVGVSPTLSKTFTWAIDLSGTMQGAGGVGGLLMVSEISNSQISNYFPTYDGNGNVSEYLDATGSIAAHYEYDPFGKTTVATGSKANDFSHRFSTKPIDVTTGLYYYGYRFYDPENGRWPSRDPIEEEGGINLYGFVGNMSINECDYLGTSLAPRLASVSVKCVQPYSCSKPPQLLICFCPRGASADGRGTESYSQSNSGSQNQPGRRNALFSAWTKAQRNAVMNAANKCGKVCITTLVGPPQCDWSP
jgi:RHS repeat-associated protein